MADFVKIGQLRSGSKEEKIMSDVVEYNDLCTTCNFGSDCVRRKHHGQPVLYCEEFSDYQEMPQKPLKAFGDYGAREKFVTSRLATASAMGLCPFCDNQGTCANSNRDGGVWHCEEYR
jgi:hypothetical protein